MPKRVYKFISPPYAISSIADRRLKLATVRDLNDPFDLCPLDTSDPIIASAWNALVRDFLQAIGILCFSRSWDNLLLWSHYGAAHTGMCLGFDIPEDEPQNGCYTDVLYQPNVLSIRSRQDLNFDLVNRLLRTKHESWSYEQEVRMFVGINDPPDEKGLYWVDFGTTLALREVIVGAQCDSANSQKVLKALESYGDAVQCSWAGMRPDAFLLAKQNRPPNWNTKATWTSTQVFVRPTF